MIAGVDVEVGSNFECWRSHSVALLRLELVLRSQTHKKGWRKSGDSRIFIDYIALIIYGILGCADNEGISVGDN